MARALTLTHVCVDSSQTVLEHHRSLYYHSVLGKRPGHFNIPRFRPAWALTWDIISIHLHVSCYLYPLKFGTWALSTREWVLARDTTVCYFASHVKFYWMMCIKFHSLVILYTPSVMLMSI